MMMNQREIADRADMIISGYAFTCEDDKIRVLNLNNMKSAAVFTKDCELIETNMCEIELRIVIDYLEKDKDFLKISEDKYA